MSNLFQVLETLKNNEIAYGIDSEGEDSNVYLRWFDGDLHQCSRTGELRKPYTVNQYHLKNYSWDKKELEAVYSGVRYEEALKFLLEGKEIQLRWKNKCYDFVYDNRSIAKCTNDEFQLQWYHIVRGDWRVKTL